MSRRSSLKKMCGGRSSRRTSQDTGSRRGSAVHTVKRKMSAVLGHGFKSFDPEFEVANENYVKFVAWVATVRKHAHEHQHHVRDAALSSQKVSQALGYSEDEESPLAASATTHLEQLEATFAEVQTQIAERASLAKEWNYYRDKVNKLQQRNEGEGEGDCSPPTSPSNLQGSDSFSMGGKENEERGPNPAEDEGGDKMMPLTGTKKAERLVRNQGKFDKVDTKFRAASKAVTAKMEALWKNRHDSAAWLARDFVDAQANIGLGLRSALAV